MIDIDRLIDYVIESNETCFDYCRSCALYRKAHGHGVYFENGHKLSDDERHIQYAYNYNSSAQNAVDALCEVLELDKEASARLYSAARAVTRWYKLTHYERCLPESLLCKLKKYIFG